MRRIKHLLIFVLLFGCGNGGDNNTTTTESNVAKVTYELDNNGCLISDNSEAFIPYSNGNNMSKTLLWNCADYAIYNDQHVELFFASYDAGQCYRYVTNYVSEGVCTKRAVAPEHPVFKIEIVNFSATPHITATETGWDIEASIRNIGNTTLFWPEARYDENDVPVFGTSWGVIPINDIMYDHKHKYFDPVPGAYDISMYLMLWDSTVVESQTNTVNLP